MAHTSTAEDLEFGAEFLTDILSYVEDAFEPDEIYGEDRLKEWIAGSLDPPDVFSTERLREWALSNGFVEE